MLILRTTVVLILFFPNCELYSDTLESTIEVQGHGEVNVKPDMVTVRARLNSAADTASRALSHSIDLLSDVTQLLARTNSIECDDIRTIHYSLEPRFERDEDGRSTNVIRDYFLTNQVAIVVRDISKLGEVLDSLTSKSVTVIDGIAFGHSDLSMFENQARRKAFSDARQKAQLYADEAALAIIGVEKIADQPPIDISRTLKSIDSDPVAFGRSRIFTTLRVVFKVGEARESAASAQDDCDCDAQSSSIPETSVLTSSQPIDSLRGVPTEGIIAEMKRRVIASKLDDLGTKASTPSATIVATGEFSKSMETTANLALMNLEHNFARQRPERLRVFKDSELMSETQRRRFIVYGDDDRKDVVELKRKLEFADAITSKQIRAQLKNALSVCCMVNKRLIHGRAETGYRARVRGTFEGFTGVCIDERFREQPILSRCTAFLVGKDIVATAGHCLKSTESVQDIAFVFDYVNDGVTSISGPSLSFPEGTVYFGKEVIAMKNDEQSGEDWALIRLDRRVAGRDPLPLDSQPVVINEQVYMIGNPMGLPTKIAGNANVKNASDKYYFRANLDAYHGNSGSPVFSDDGHSVVGILTGGGRDFEQLALRNGCLRTIFVGSTNSEGEYVVRIDGLRKALSSAVD